jgi:purine nucleosidase
MYAARRNAGKRIMASDSTVDKLWIDTDPGVDDTVALALLFAARDQVDVVGISTVFGNVGVDQTTRNAALLLEAAGLDHLPLSRGAYMPLCVPLDTSPFVHGANGLGDMGLPSSGPSMEESSLRAPQAIIDVILRNPHEITLVPIGPLTNIAMAYQLEPSIAKLVRKVVIMGGAVRCPGNITPAAEANFYHDPHAAQIVVQAGWPIVLAGWDVCAYGMVPEDLVRRICAGGTPLAPFIAGSLPFFRSFLEGSGLIGSIRYPDVLAAAYLLEPELFEAEELPLYVETEGACRGQSVAVPRGKWYQNKSDTRFFPADEKIAPVKVLFRARTEGILALLERLLT